jgi:hypothetical protein
MNLEDLLTNIFSHIISSGFWKLIDYFVNKKRINNRNNEILLDTSTIEKEKFQYNNYHGNTPLTYTGNGKFGDHY